MTQRMFVVKKGAFSATHHHAEEEEHGHDWVFEVTLYGKVNDYGYVEDFRKVDGIIKERIIKPLSYKSLNRILDNPTTENLAIWIFNELEPDFTGLLQNVKLYETAESWVIYTRPEEVSQNTRTFRLPIPEKDDVDYK